MTLLLPSCFEEEDPVPPHDQGDLEEGQVALGPAYGDQAYFDLSENAVVASNAILDWDLSFEGASGGWVIRLNSARFMLAGNSLDTIFSADLVPEELDMRFDKSDGNPDSTAIGAWYALEEDTIRPYRYVYLLDLGSNELGEPLGYKKVRFDLDGNELVLRYANTDNSGDRTERFSVDPDTDRTYFSFDSGVLGIAPKPDQWSLFFTRYTTMLVTDEGEDYPYLVVGALLNPDGVLAARDSIHEFGNIDINLIPELEFTEQADIIGYDWKYYDFDAGVYTIVPDMNYVIRDRDGFYYKLRFIGFYSNEGVKGYPTFEYVRL